MLADLRLFKNYFEPEFKKYGDCYDKLCPDGLLYRNRGEGKKYGNESELWNDSNRRICFLLKDANAIASGKNIDGRTYERMYGNFGHNEVIFQCNETIKKFDEETKLL